MTPKQVESFNRLVVAYGGETLFRPSAADRWLHCPGSIQLGSTVKRDNKSSSYALQGTAAHLVFNEALAGVREPEEWADRRVVLEEKDASGKPIEVYVDAEMVDAINFSAAIVNDVITPWTNVHLEYFLSLQPLDASYPLLGQNRGTADVALVNTQTRELDIMDLKYGQGVMVPANAPQLKDYALMGLINFPIEGGWSKVRTTIIQPRSRDEQDRIRVAEFDPNELMGDFVGQLVGAMEAALEPDAPLKVDPTGKYCRWCPAKSVCPALQMAGTSVTAPMSMIAASVAATTPMPPILKNTPQLPDVVLMGPEAISIVLERRHVYDAWIEAVEQRAANMMSAGLEVPGWEMGKRTGNRAWKDAKAAEVTLRKDFGLSVIDIYKPYTMNSPAQIEKLIDKPRRKEMDALVERPEGALYIKRADGKKEAVPPVLGALPKTV